MNDEPNNSDEDTDLPPSFNPKPEPLSQELFSREEVQFGLVMIVSTFSAAYGLYTWGVPLLLEFLATCCGIGPAVS